jgi:hypothetical protein
MCRSETAHMYRAAHMCHSEMAHMYRVTYIYAVPRRHICAQKKSLFLSFKKIKKVEFVLDHYEAFLKVSRKSVE